MQGTQNAERLMKLVKENFQIKNTREYNLAYSECMNMKIVYANETEERKILFPKILKLGLKIKGQ